MLLKETALINVAGLVRIPVIAFVGPRIEALDDEHCILRIPYTWRNKNHVGAMYLGSLAVGGELTPGMLALHWIRKGHKKVVPIFKDFHADFLKLCKGDVYFRCNAGRAIAEAVAKADSSGERVTIPVEAVATVPSQSGEEPVLKVTVGLSLKRK
jgi:acyl-coenzyme A thioesterase PaaI-like protein